MYLEENLNRNIFKNIVNFHIVAELILVTYFFIQC